MPNEDNQSDGRDNEYDIHLNFANAVESSSTEFIPKYTPHSLVDILEGVIINTAQPVQYVPCRGSNYAFPSVRAFSGFE